MQLWRQYACSNCCFLVAHCYHHQSWQARCDGGSASRRSRSQWTSTVLGLSNSEGPRSGPLVNESWRVKHLMDCYCHCAHQLKHALLPYFGCAVAWCLRMVSACDLLSIPRYVHRTGWLIHRRSWSSYHISGPVALRFVIGRACCCIQAASVRHNHDKPSFRETVLMSCLYTGFISLYTGIILQICKAYSRRKPVILPPKSEIQPKQSVYYSVNRRQYTDISAYWQ